MSSCAFFNVLCFFTDKDKEYSLEILSLGIVVFPEVKNQSFKTGERVG